MSWRPSASINALQLRAVVLKRIRDFFAERGVMEVETPALARTTVTDPHIHSLPVVFQPPGFSKADTFYLQTSPEYAMKRLLAAGSGPIYQMCKAFRADPPGPLHNPEFTMLEWYRPDFDHHDLMNEMDALLIHVLGTAPAKRISYASAFQQYTALNPHTANAATLAAFGAANIATASPISHPDDWLDLIMSHCIEPNLGTDCPVFVYDFPVTKAALAKIRHHESPPVASRFEVYFKGIELANGFHELQDAAEQSKRFHTDLIQRENSGILSVPMDRHLLEALQSGLPNCAGVALGIDRLIMLKTESAELAQILSFDFGRA